MADVNEFSYADYQFFSKSSYNGCKKVHALHTQITVSDVYGWTASTVAFYWIPGVHKTWKPWVQTRVDKIRNASIKWNHVPGIQNPADVATREIFP